MISSQLVFIFSSILSWAVGFSKASGAALDKVTAVDGGCRLTLKPARKKKKKAKKTFYIN